MTDLDYALISALVVVLLFSAANWARGRTAPAPSVSFVQPSVAVDLTEPVKTQLAAYDERLKHVEHDVKNVRTAMSALPNKSDLPSKDLVHRMEVQMAEMRGQIGTIEATSNSTARQVERIAGHLLSEK